MATIGAELGKEMALLTDGRFSGGSRGVLIRHIAREVMEAGLTALVENSDQVVIDAESKVVELDVSQYVYPTFPLFPSGRQYLWERKL